MAGLIKGDGMRVYLDNCVFNRPFDDQSQIRIRLEAEAKLYVQEKIKNRDIELVWSYILDIENDMNPFAEKRRAIRAWKKFMAVDIEENDALLAMARAFALSGIHTKDALHVASAIAGEADYFLTTDDKLLKKLSSVEAIKAINPVDIVEVIDEYNN